MKLGKHTLPIGERTCIMGVLNVTPDSFSDGGRYANLGQAVEEALKMAANGADIIDIGGESSRPGSRPVQASEEIDRVVPVIEALAKKINVPLSVDTYKSEVARVALAGGATIVNDIRALKGSVEMAGVISEFNAGAVLMHMKGSPENMQEDPQYGDLFEEVSGYLVEAIAIAEDAGVDPEKIIIDPGIGFGKTLEHNLLLLRDLRKLKQLGKPILVGASRKSFIGSITDKDVTDRAFGTAASVAVAIMNGADIIRVHDVSEMHDVARVVDAITGA